MQNHLTRLVGCAVFWCIEEVTAHRWETCLCFIAFPVHITKENRGVSSGRILKWLAVWITIKIVFPGWLKLLHLMIPDVLVVMYYTYRSTFVSYVFMLISFVILWHCLYCFFFFYFPAGLCECLARCRRGIADSVGGVQHLNEGNDSISHRQLYAFRVVLTAYRT